MTPAKQSAELRPEASTTKLLIGLGIALAVVLLLVSLFQSLGPNWMGQDPQSLADAQEAEQQAQQAARAKLFSDTEVFDQKPIAIGEGAEALNEAEPFSKLPIEAAQPFSLGRANLVDRNRALQCLTQAIYYEAGYEPLPGRRAVAQVILNRLRHPAFPNTVCGVVYQGSSKPGCQFSFTCDGSLKRVPEKSAWREAEAIARSALAGTTEPTVGMATHYHADYVFPKWASKLPKIERIGAHLFYRWPGNWGRRIAFSDGYRGAEAIPALSSLAGWNDLPMEELATDADPRLDRTDQTDRRTDNDVGGRLDTRTTWRLSFADPDKAATTYQQTVGEQVVTESEN